MPDIIEINDPEAIVKGKIIDILEYDGISTSNITSWGVATVRLNLAATRLGFPLLFNGQNGLEARNIINSLAVSPPPVLPQNTELPQITGDPEYLGMLETSNGEWNAYPVAEYTYQWVSDGNNISGATDNDYNLTINEIGKEVSVIVTATNFSGAVQAQSNSVGPITSLPINTSLPSITGEDSYQEELTTSNGTWVAYPLPITYSYKWFSNDVEIVGADENTYTTTVNDIGKVINSQVTGTNSEGNNFVESADFGPINSYPVNVAQPTISGYPRTGQTLTVLNGTWAAYPLPINYTYKWYADGVEIAGANSNSFVVSDTQYGKKITASVEATNTLGNDSELTAETRFSEPSWSPMGATLTTDFLNARYFLANPIDTHPQNIFFDNNAGVLQDIAPNVLTRTDRGLLSVPTRTNAVKDNTSNTILGLTDVVRTNLTPGDSPAGDNFGKLITQGPSTSANHSFVSNPDQWITAGSKHTCSIFLKYTGSTRYLRVILSDNVSMVKQCWVDLVGKVVGNISAGCTASIKEYANGWLELNLITNEYPNTTTFGQFSLYSAAGMGSATREAGNYAMWGGQVELNTTFCTPMILTNGSAATRTGNIPMTTVPAGARAFIFEFNQNEPIVGSISRYLLCYTNGTNLERNLLFVGSSGTTTLTSTSGGSNTTSPSGLPAVTQGRNIFYGVIHPTYRRAGKVGVGDSSISSQESNPTINRLGFLGSGLTSPSSNMYGISRRYSEAPVSDFSTPEDAYNWAKSIAESWL